MENLTHEKLSLKDTINQFLSKTGGNHDLADFLPILSVLCNTLCDVLEKLVQTQPNFQSFVRDFKYYTRQVDEAMKSQQLQNNVYATIENTSSQANQDFPFKKTKDLQNFDKTLENQANKDRLKSLFALATTGSIDPQADIQNLLSILISKSVQMKYSFEGKGKTVNNEPKKNFSKLTVCLVLIDFIKKKYVTSNSVFNINTIISRWFSGAGDREGGRKLRMQK